MTTCMLACNKNLLKKHKDSLIFTYSAHADPIFRVPSLLHFHAYICYDPKDEV